VPAAVRDQLGRNRITESGPAGGLGIDVQGETESITRARNRLRETRQPLQRVGIRVGARTRDVRLIDNRCKGSPSPWGTCGSRDDGGVRPASYRPGARRRGLARPLPPARQSRRAGFRPSASHRRTRQGKQSLPPHRHFATPTTSRASTR
jgi:hypothetical protein